MGNPNPSNIAVRKIDYKSEVQILKDKVAQLEFDLHNANELVEILQHKALNSVSMTNIKSLIKVLVVEDSFIAQSAAKTLLSSMGCLVDIAANGKEVLHLCEQTDYDLIFMDISLGEGMDGYELTHQIRTKTDAKKYVPIIALTAHGSEESRQRCLDVGMDAVLTKPLTHAHAIEVLNQFLPARQLAPERASTQLRVDLPDQDGDMFQLNQFALIDSEEGLSNCRTEDLLYELLTLLSIELPSDLAQMTHAFESANYDLVEETAHKIKSGAIYVGTTRMKYACQYLESYLKAGQRELYDALYYQAVNTIEETITFIEGWLRR
jgi:CheY-like chemotaxis protein/HPt (histidine-containing phosphotransfer) domain-containing protein